MNINLHAPLFYFCTQRWRMVNISVGIGGLVGYLAVQIHKAKLGRFVPALWGTFECGFLATQVVLLGVIVMVGMAKPLPFTKSKFTLSPGLLSRGRARLHWSGEKEGLQLKGLLSDLANTVAYLDEQGLKQLELFSVLLGDPTMKRLVAARIQRELERQGSSWKVSDGGSLKSRSHDFGYWVRFQAVPRILKALGLSDKAPVDMNQFKQGADSGMTWGVLMLEKR